MAADTFLKIAEIPGESTDENHKDWIEILSFSTGVSQAVGDRSTGGAAASGRCNHQDFSCTKMLDKASPKLALSCSKGDPLKEVTIELCRATGDKQPYMMYKLTNAIISSYSTGGGGGGVPTETVSFNYAKVEWTYTETDHLTGKAGGNVETYWDLEKNVGG